MKLGYITTTQRQSNNQWSGSIAAHLTPPHPKEFQVQKSAGKVLASIFWDQDGTLLIDLSSKGPNYQREVLLISAGAIEGLLKEKRQRRGKVT